MSGDRYFIRDQNSCYFLTLTVIHWIDLFSRKAYRDIMVDALNYCIQYKGLRLYAWVIMSNHVHLVGRVVSPYGMSGFLRDFKKYTSKQMVAAIKSIPESRRSWLLDKFAFEARRTGRAQYFKVWKDDNHAVDLSKIDVMNKINYIHNNPVAAGIVEEGEYYIYSSARDYAGRRGLVAVEVV